MLFAGSEWYGDTTTDAAVERVCAEIEAVSRDKDGRARTLPGAVLVDMPLMSLKRCNCALRPAVLLFRAAPNSFLSLPEHSLSSPCPSRCAFAPCLVTVCTGFGTSFTPPATLTSCLCSLYLCLSNGTMSEGEAGVSGYARLRLVPIVEDNERYASGLADKARGEGGGA